MARRAPLRITYQPDVDPVVVDIQAKVEQPGRVKDLFDLLVADHQRKGKSKDQAEAAAFDEIEKMHETAHGGFRAQFVRAKGKTLDHLLAIEQETMSFYDALMRSTDEPDLGRLRTLLESQDALFDDLKKPARKHLDDMAPVDPDPRPIEPMPAEAFPARAKKIEPPISRLKSVIGQKDWRIEGEGDAQVAIKTLDAGEVTVRVKAGTHTGGSPVLEATFSDGVRKTTVEEFQVETSPYGTLDPASPLLNAHHFCQGHLMKMVFGELYDYRAQPTIWLRNGVGGSPHYVLTHFMQKDFHARFKGDDDKSYGKIRDQAVLEMRTVGAPEPQIRAAIKAQDAKVFDMIKHLPEAEQKRLLGDMKRYY